MKPMDFWQTAPQDFWMIVEHRWQEYKEVPQAKYSGMSYNQLHDMIDNGEIL